MSRVCFVWDQVCLGCVLCGIRCVVFVLGPVKILSCEGAWCGVVVLEICVLWLKVASYVIFEYFWKKPVRKFKLN